jgi:hypothetical protein
MRHILLLAALILGGCGGRQARVAVPAGGAEPPDPSSRVARLSLLDGDVSFRPAGGEEWLPAVLNRPLTSGDDVWTESGARAELHLGTASFRLGPRTQVSLLQVGSDLVQIRIAEGAVAVHVRELEENEQFEFDTPQAAVSLLRTGQYRINVSGDGAATEVIVRTGSAELLGNGFSTVVRADQLATVPAASGGYAIAQAPSMDALDRFAQERDRREERALARRHVAAGVIGYEDLEEYGLWEVDAMWGPLWMPRVAVGWAPYRYGHWVWIEPWGWTWIEDARWGFAPFHYGRWIFHRARWCWLPGPFHRRPVWAPALVVFGGGSGFRYHFQMGIGPGVAWFPLGPREVWLPPYRTSRRYVTNINVTNTVIVNVNNISRTDPARQRYVNRDVPDAITAMPRDPFLRGEPAQKHTVRVPAADLRAGGSAPPFAPTADSLGRRGDRTAPRPPVAVEKRPVVVRQPPPAPVVPLERRRGELDSSMGRVPPPKSAEPSRQAPRPEYRQLPAPAPRAEPRRTPTPTRRPDPQWQRSTERSEQQRQETIQRERRQLPAPTPQRTPERGTQRPRPDRVK